MWRFVHITDLHLASSRDGVWNNGFLCSMMPEVMDCLRDDLQKINPDFLLLSGDIVSNTTRESVFQARDMVESLGFPYYPLGGNHDCYSRESRQWFLDAYAHRLPNKKTWYSFTHKQTGFYALDPWWMHPDGSLSPSAEKKAEAMQQFNLNNMRWALPKEQLLWLEEELASATEESVCIATHYPMLSVPDRLLQLGFKNAGSLENGKVIAEKIADFPKVRLVLSGHVHANTIQPYKGVYHVTTSSLPEYPVEFRVIEVHDDQWKITTQKLSDPSFAQRSLLAGHDFTAGLPEDRKLSIKIENT
ncbi:MAG: hypothetical protein GX130_03385 [Candidatus Hydrogenedens sp.]|jgi:3',5'-cyclic AMP phosphodiesterase CpdA|nr:hypothetical protein [Candidatus Hydrogenedens sp.]